MIGELIVLGNPSGMVRLIRLLSGTCMPRAGDQLRENSPYQWAYHEMIWPVGSQEDGSCETLLLHLVSQALNHMIQLTKLFFHFVLVSVSVS